jgi:tetratricopeptide (TPR) repeat protein
MTIEAASSDAREWRMSTHVRELTRAALAAAHDESATALERAEMLMEVAMSLQQRPKTTDHLRAAVLLYDEALSVCPGDSPLVSARITARKGTALQAIPEQGTQYLERARAAYDSALPVLQREGAPQEVAEALMNLGLVLQQLAAHGRAPIVESISAYQRALRTFDARRYPVEFAILQNNLATAFLSLPLADERAKIREALAVQCFEAALQVVNLIEHPSEYAMLQNNLGNALQYASSSHAFENSLRAIAAYDEALKVRTPASTPLEYANTLANKANCLLNLPDDPQLPEQGNPDNRARARAYLEEARSLFEMHGALDNLQLVAETLAALDAEPAAARAG